LWESFAIFHYTQQPHGKQQQQQQAALAGKALLPIGVLHWSNPSLQATATERTAAAAAGFVGG